MVGRIPEKVCDGSLRQMLLIPRIFRDADTTLYYSFSRLSANIKPNYLKKKKKGLEETDICYLLNERHLELSRGVPSLLCRELLVTRAQSGIKLQGNIQHVIPYYLNANHKADEFFFRLLFFFCLCRETSSTKQNIKIQIMT